MIFDGRDDRIAKDHLYKDQCPDLRVDLCLFELGGREIARFVQNMVGHGQFADIVEKGAGAECVYVALGKREQLADPDGIYLGSPDVSQPDLISGIDSGGKSLDRRPVDAACLSALFCFLRQTPDMQPTGENRYSCVRPEDKAYRPSKLIEQQPDNRNACQ